MLNPCAASAAERAASQAINLDDHSRVRAGEVGDKAFENDLAAEPEAPDLLPAEAPPKPALGAGRVAAQGPGEGRQ